MIASFLGSLEVDFIENVKAKSELDELRFI